MCPHCQTKAFKRRGFYLRTSGHKMKIQRFQCAGCQKSFSSQTSAFDFGQRKSYINQSLYRHLVAGVSQRKCSELLGINKKTVARKIICLGAIARACMTADRGIPKPETVVVFDEMETFEHTKCKPLSIALAVEQNSRRIIGCYVSQMPAKGPLAEMSRRKYGFRPDHRSKALRQLLGNVAKTYPLLTVVKSDECPRYPKQVTKILSHATHVTYKGRRGCVVGQGELKRGGFDPLFSLNHTCAMLRDNIKRLSRRTWCTTKIPERLQDLVDMYSVHHNEKIAGGRRPFTLLVRSNQGDQFITSNLLPCEVYSAQGPV